MTSKFQANLPKQAWSLSTRHQWPKNFFVSLRHFLFILIFPLIPYEDGPQPPFADFPQKTASPSDEQLAQCQTIFDEAESRRSHIEQKAQWTFTVIAFLVPLLASVFTFLIRGSSSPWGRYIFTLSLLGIATLLLLLSFIGAVRASAIRRREFLFLDSVINPKNGRFKKYDKILHAQGLMYCATMNTATNDHLAQFVKSAHLAMFSAVIVFAIAAASTSLLINPQLKTPVIKTKTDETVLLSDRSVSALNDDLQRILAAQVTNDNSSQYLKQQLDLLNRLKTLQSEVDALKTQLSAKPLHPRHSVLSVSPKDRCNKQ